MTADDDALRRFVAKHFSPGTDPYSPDVLKKLTEELQKELQRGGAKT